ncbi:MAG: hypothetical protein CMH54_06330 [Myxococcales bacterium]|nr:hypothetical protein [Myxococcales bacterium]
MDSNTPKDTDGAPENDGGFQVHDRRVSQADESSTNEAPEEVVAAEEPTPTPEEKTQAEPPAPSRFSRLIASLHMTALYHLGLVPGPQGEKPTPNLAMARENIDILLELKEKTRGNLTEPEAALMSQAVQDLQHHFVQAAMSTPPENTNQGGPGSP